MQLNFGMTCHLCGNKDDKKFYIMPLQEKVGLNDVINCQDKYKITCKQCGKSYIFMFKIQELELTSKAPKENQNGR